MADDRKQGGDAAAVIVIPCIVGFMLFGLWVVNRAGLYYGSAKMAYYMLAPGDVLAWIHEYRLSIVRDVLHKPDPFQVIAWVNAAWRAPAILFAVLCIWLAKKRWSHPIVKLKGTLSVDALLHYQAMVHSPIAPIVPIARDMHKNLDPRWHESYRAFEAIEKFGLHMPGPGQVEVPEPEEQADENDEAELWAAPPQQAEREEQAKPTVHYPPLVREKVEAYFLKQLGRRIYFPGVSIQPRAIAKADTFSPAEIFLFGRVAPFLERVTAGRADWMFKKRLGSRQFKPAAGQAGGTFYPDYLNPYEKAIFALFAPLAIKGAKGLPEYFDLRDRLNRSAVNKAQKPTLSLANDLFQEYRANPKINALFERHHFSVTYLMQFFVLAKRAGRVTTADFLGWLRPNEHNLFVALETVGRKVAFTESGGSYCHWMFEKHCYRRKRTPILPCVTPAVLSLEDEWRAHHESAHRETEETIWGRMRNGANGMSADEDLFARYVRDVMYAGSGNESPPIAVGEESIFDKEEGGARLAAAAAVQEAEDAALRAMMSNVKKTT